MKYIKGKLKKIIFKNDSNGYLVGLFRLAETDEEELKSKLNHLITVTGIMPDAKLDVKMKITGDYILNDKFGYQFTIDKVEIEKPTTVDGIVDFLSSAFIESCGVKTAKKIVDVYKGETIEKIKEDINNLTDIGIPIKRATLIRESLLNYTKSSDTILKLQELGFSIDECSRIYNKFANVIDSVIENDFYDISEVIDFAKVDNVYVNNYGEDTDARIYACLLQTMKLLSFNEGDTFSYQDEITSLLARSFKIHLDEDSFNEKMSYLIKTERIVKIDERYYLKDYYDKEVDIAYNLYEIDNKVHRSIKNLTDKLKNLEEQLGIDYNVDQEKAIISALNNNVTIISGGPGTGKTTIINAIVKLYIDEYRIDIRDVCKDIALLAPTGRASKKMSSSTNLPASTIHRYLKWFKDKDEFFFNELNKTCQKLIIVDEVSMIDIDLFDALLKGIRSNVKLILVGDVFQLPSVGPGLVLNDLIESDYFNYIPLNQIYRQSSNSYIPYLAKEIKNVDLSEDFLNKKDDFAFFQTPKENIRSMIEQIISYSKEKKIDEREMQILAPMYRGDNGIDNLNILLQSIYNPKSKNKNELMYGDVIYREGDKVLQLVNDLDNNVFNGDIGYIKDISKQEIVIDFDGNKVIYKKGDLKEIKHAYAITIHKSQGSEFDHVVMPICNSYYKMLYNKLIYTGVSRAKKSLTIVGDVNSFYQAVRNNYSSLRKTSLKERIFEVYNKENEE